MDSSYGMNFNMVTIKLNDEYKYSVCVEIKEVINETSDFSTIIPSAISILKHSDGTYHNNYNKTGLFYGKDFENEQDMIDDLKTNDLLDENDICKIIKMLNITKGEIKMDNLICNKEGYVIGVEDTNEVDWNSISSNKKLSRRFMRKFENELNWVRISKHQELSEKTASRFRDRLCWSYVSMHQKLSESFIRELKKEQERGEENEKRRREYER